MALSKSNLNFSIKTLIEKSDKLSNARLSFKTKLCNSNLLSNFPY